MTQDPPFHPVREALGLLVEPGTVAELRAIGSDGRVSSGFFDDVALMATAAEVLDASGEFSGIYLTLNPVNPALLARRANRVQSRLSRKDATTADGDIVRRRWLPIDVDPVRPSGISATADEHRAACRVARAIGDALTGGGWPRPVVADSGNGGHLLYRVDLPNDAASTDLVKGVLAALDLQFSSDVAKVDTANFNAARIWKCYGTVSRKGDSTKERPHNRSAIVTKPFEAEVVPAPLLQALAAPEPPSWPPAASGGKGAGTFDLRAWLDEHGIAIAMEKPWQGGTLFSLQRCPFSDAHADGAYAIQFPNGAIHAACKHDSCGGGAQRWPELRARFEPERAKKTETRPKPADCEVRPEPAKKPDAGRDGAVVKKAREVLEHGDPVRYFLDCFERDHVGDGVLARCLIASIASQTVRNTHGIHVYVTGESGKGKSSGMTAMLRQVPDEVKLAERLSNKALYYSDDLNAGTVLMLDDIALSEELQEILKEATTKFTRRIRQRIVTKERKIQHCTIPERCVWWLANVSALYDDQVLNRMLIAWVDDSEEQDREVFKRKLQGEERDPEEVIEDSFELRVCRDMWRVLKKQGLVYVQVPFARRIRMASVRNRRNPDVLLDLVRSHTLLHLFQRERRTLKDDRLSVVATEADFAAAASLFVDLHTTGGSLTAKFDRNEQLALSLASHYRAEQFCLADLQRWTGWNYQKARRLMLGYDSRGSHYPGLLDKSPALSLVDQTVSEVDGEGRDVKRRSLVFIFNEEAYRKAQFAGQVWLEEESSFSSFSKLDPAERPAERVVKPQSSTRSDKNRNSEEIIISTFSRSDCTGGDGASGNTDFPICTPPAERPERKNEELTLEGESRHNATKKVHSANGSAAETAERPVIDPHAFVSTDGPEWEPCTVCGTKPSFYREKWYYGLTERRRFLTEVADANAEQEQARFAPLPAPAPFAWTPRWLCARCYGAAVAREQAKLAPLPGTVDLAAMERITASVGRCTLCGLAPATWAGDGVRLCEACYGREVQRRVEQGLEFVTPTSGTGAADVRS